MLLDRIGIRKFLLRRGRRGVRVAALLLAALAAMCFSVRRWVLATWPGLRTDELIVQLSEPITGTGGGIVGDGLRNGFIPPAVVLIALAAVSAVQHILSSRYAAGSKDGNGRGPTLWKAAIAVSAVVILAEAVIFADRIELGRFVSNQTGTTDFIERHCTDPADVEFVFPQKKRNLIYIYLESMEKTYADQAHGGAFGYNNIPMLTALSGMEGSEDFSGDSGTLNGGRVLPGSTFTMAAMFTQASGLPMKVRLTDPLPGSVLRQGKMYPGVTNLGDILRKEGYRQLFVLGSDASFGGRRKYYEEHGAFEICDYPYAKLQGLIPEDYFAFWGMEDSKTIAMAKEKLTELSGGEQPFCLTMLTVDTHFEDGYECSLCRGEYGDDVYANAIACSDRQIASFVDWVKEQPFYDNTTIVISGDHLTMDSDFCNDVPDTYERAVYTVFVNAAAEPEDPHRERHYTTQDYLPTTLAALGASWNSDRLGLGTNLFSSCDTLLEEYGYVPLAQEIEHGSEYMNALAAQ